jgi:N-acetylmuramoyl-L-alanine amidase
MYKIVEEKSVQKTDEKPICKMLPRHVLFLIPTVLVVMLFGAIMGAIAGLKNRPDMLEGEVVKLETIDDRVTQITEIKKNELAMVEEATSKKVDSEVKKKNPENVSIESGKINDEILFKVQILISKTPLESNSPWFKGVKNVWEYTDSSLYKYTVGNKRDIQSASALQSELRKKGFSDAFVVAFQNGKRIPLRKALRFSS